MEIWLSLFRVKPIVDAWSIDACAIELPPCKSANSRILSGNWQVFYRLSVDRIGRANFLLLSRLAFSGIFQRRQLARAGAGLYR